jgi:hypothetical protein
VEEVGEEHELVQSLALCPLRWQARHLSGSRQSALQWPLERQRWQNLLCCLMNPLFLGDE